jgi:cell division protein FtsQ
MVKLKLRARITLRKKRKEKILFAVALLMVFALGLFTLINFPYFNVKTIIVNGNNFLSEEEVIKVLGVSTGENIFKIDAEILSKSFLHPRIETVEIEKRLPSTLIVTIKERESFAFVLQEDILAEVDYKGIILSIEKNTQRFDLPIITGLKIDELFIGKKISNDLFTAAQECFSALSSSLRQEISEIHVQEDGQFILFFSGGLKVIWGDESNSQRKGEMLEALLPGLRKYTPQVEYIDLRFKDRPIVKMRSESRGVENENQ